MTHCCATVTTHFNRVVSAVIGKVLFISKLTFDYRYIYAIAKADVRLPGSSLPGEFLFRGILMLS